MNLEAEDVGIVFIGNFNPAIFHPEWLFSHGLISEGEKDFATIPENFKVVHNAVTEFSLKSDLNLLVTVDRFQLRGDFKWNHDVRDHTVGIFSLLEHCPVTAMGVNRSMHFKMASQDEQRQLLDGISQVNIFNSIIEGPRLQLFEIRGKRPNHDDGFISIQVSPSLLIDPGILIHVNSHHGKSDKSRLEIGTLLRELESSWDEMMSFAFESATKIMEVQQ